MRLEQLQQIIEIEKQQSISKAARALFMGQPSLSSSLNSLEGEIGVRLFERTHQRCDSHRRKATDILQIGPAGAGMARSQILNYGETKSEICTAR